MGTRGAWAAAWGLGTPPYTTWCLGLASVLGSSLRHLVFRLPTCGLSTPQRTHATWASLPWPTPAPYLGTPGAWVTPLTQGEWVRRPTYD